MLDLHRIDQCRPEPLIQLRLDADATPEGGAQQIAHAAHDLVQIDQHRRQFLLARERQQLSHQIGTPAGGLQNHRHPSPMRRVIAKLAAQDLGIADDCGKQIVEVMRHTGGQPADRCHRLCLVQPLLGLPTRRHVGVQRDKPAAWQRIAPDLEVPATRPRPLDRAHGGAGTQQRQSPRDLGLDIHGSELACRHLAAQNLLHRQADTEDLRRHAGELGKVLVPRHQPKIAIDHHDAVAHAGQRRLENRLFVRERLVPARCVRSSSQCQ